MPSRDYYLPARRLVDQADASLVKAPRVPRSKFVGAWTRKTAFDAGYLYPILVEEVMPGDYLSYDVTAYLRMSTPLFPIFDNQRVDTHFFFVPCRLVWEEWEAFMGEQADPDEDIDALSVPVVPLTSVTNSIGSIYDHFGLPTVGQLTPGETLNVNALPFRAYNLIYNEWFRDQNLQDSLVVDIGNGPDDPADYALVRRNKFHDYLTSALPFPQKFTAPRVAMEGIAPVQGIGLRDFAGGPSNSMLNWLQTEGDVVYDWAYELSQAAFDPALLTVGIQANSPTHPTEPGYPLIFAHMTGDVSFDLTAFREAILVQELLERDARGGTRYIELIKNHFGVNSLDARLQRPEYIGGGSSQLTITPIAQTAPTASAPLGALGAAGTAAGSHRANYAATEHGYIIGLLSVRTELSYQQGISKMWTRESRLDFYWPTLAGLSEQAILRKEIFCTGDPDLDDQVWGYQERWQEYRTRLSEVTGIMRSAAAGTLDAWHLAQEFSPAPSLNSAFIQDDPPMDRVLAAGALADGQQYLADILYRRTRVAPMPTYGIPASLTHF